MRLFCVVAVLSQIWTRCKGNVIVQPFFEYEYGPDTTASYTTSDAIETITSNPIVQARNTTTQETTTFETTKAVEKKTTTETIRMETTADIDLFGDIDKYLFTTDVPELTTLSDIFEYGVEEADVVKNIKKFNPTTIEQINFFDYTDTNDYWTTDSGVAIGLLPIGGVWSIWDEAWIWIVIGILIFIFVILIPAIIIAICCCGCCRCKQNPRDEKNADSLSIRSEASCRENVPIYESFPVDSPNEEEPTPPRKKSSEDENATQESKINQDQDKNENDLETLKSIVIDIEDPLKDRPISPLSTDAEQTKAKQQKPNPEKTLSKASSFSAPKPANYVDYPRVRKASSVGSERQNNPTEVKINIGNEAIIGSSAFHVTSNKPGENHNKGPRPTPKKRHTMSPTRRDRGDHKRASRRRKDPEKRRRRHVSDHRKKPTDIKKNKDRKNIESKQMQLLKTANSIEDLIEAITRFTKEHPIPDSHEEPLKPIKLDQARMREHNKKSAPKPTRRHTEDKKDTRNDRRRERGGKKTNARPRARGENRPNERTAAWAKQQQNIRGGDNKPQNKDRGPKRRDNSFKENDRRKKEKPHTPKEPDQPKPVLVQTQPNAKDSKEEYAEEQRRKKLERDLKKMKKYCNKIIPTEEANATPIPATS